MEKRTPTAAHSPAPTADDILAHLNTTLAAMDNIHFMRSRDTYELPIGGQLVTGQKEAFLRRRTATEIIDSALSSGCGDYALAYIHPIQRPGLKVWLIDAAELSRTSLRSRFSGHAVVAVCDLARDRWYLVDPTAKRILSDNWSPESFTFGRYWIGYKGPAKDYPVHGPEGLRAFYTKTLEQVPAGVWAQHLVEIQFLIDESLRTPDGGYVNPRIPQLLKMASESPNELDVRPQRCVHIRLVRGEDGTRSKLTLAEDGWICRVGTRSGLSRRFFEGLERQVTVPRRGRGQRP